MDAVAFGLNRRHGFDGITVARLERADGVRQRRSDDDGRLQITITERPDQVELTFRDNGCGMPPDVIEHLFEPFFTTKEVGQGTGLGLSISQRIVCDHDGTLEAESDGAGHGSTFRLRLPTAQPVQQLAA